MGKKDDRDDIPGFEKIHSFHKLLICIGVGVLVYFLVDIKDIDPLTHIMIGWNAFSLCVIVMSWITFSITNSDQMRILAQEQDQSRSIIFITVLISTLASVCAVILLIITKESGEGSPWRLPIAIASLLFSWFLIHTTFALRYAHIFYGDSEMNSHVHAGGLDFPKEKNPNYMDFAYFSFVLGMTFQVSDVEITSRRLRKMAMFHGLISFGFSTIMIGLTINVMTQ